MATTPSGTQSSVLKAGEQTKRELRLCDKMKAQLNTAVLRGGKITAEELSDLENHVKKVRALVD